MLDKVVEPRLKRLIWIFRENHTHEITSCLFYCFLLSLFIARLVKAILMFFIINSKLNFQIDLIL